MTDTLISSSRFRALNIIDDFNREALAIEAASSITGLRLTRILDKVPSYRRSPKQIRCDNGPELRSKALAQWVQQPGKPTQNVIIEGFNGTYRREALNAYLFKFITHVQNIANRRLDAILGHVPPRRFAQKKLLLQVGK